MSKVSKVGYVIGRDSRTPAEYKRLVELKETKMFWITADGAKFNKTTGHMVARDAKYKLDLTTLRTCATGTVCQPVDVKPDDGVPFAELDQVQQDIFREAMQRCDIDVSILGKPAGQSA